jgi:hypothetical protein
VLYIEPTFTGRLLEVVAPVKIPAKRLEGSILDGAPDVLHQSGEKPQIMDRIQPGTEHLFDTEQMMKVGSGIAATNRARTGRVDRTFVPGILSLFYHHASEGSEEPPGASMAGRHDAIEHVDTSRNPLD